MPLAGLHDLTLDAFRADGTRCRVDGDGRLCVQVRSDGRTLPLSVDVLEHGLCMSVPLGAAPGPDALRALMRFHAHAVAGAVTVAVRAGDLHARTFTPLPDGHRRRSLISESLALMAQRLIGAHRMYVSGGLDEVLELGSLPPSEMMGGQTLEGGELADRVQLALQELLMPVEATIPGRRLFTAGTDRAAVGVEVVGVLLRVAAVACPRPADASLAALLAPAPGSAVFGLENTPGAAGDHLVAVATTKLPDELRTVGALRGVLAGMCADVDELVRVSRTPAS